MPRLRNNWRSGVVVADCKHVPPSSQTRSIWLPVLFSFYGVLALTSMSVRPLWLDEVLQLSGTAGLPSLRALLDWIPINPGAVPLGYLIQRPFVLVGGLAAFWARLPSLLFGLLSCWTIVLICRQVRICATTTLLAVGMFMFLPSSFRYATEARPYAEGLAFSALSTLALLKLIERPSLLGGLMCSLAMIGGLYTQPYAFLSACGAAAAGLAVSLRQNHWRAAASLASTVVVSAAAFIPWYSYSAKIWDERIQLAGYQRLHLTPTLMQDAFKGLSGGSLLCSLSLVALAVVGVFTGGRSTLARSVFASSTVLTAVGALALDFLKSYFFAPRQVIFGVPGLAILAALGFYALLEWNKFVAIALGAVLFLTALGADIGMQLNVREDWAAASKVLSKVADNGYCLQAADPSDNLALYRVFAPGLPSSTCAPAGSPSKVALLSNLYGNPSQTSAMDDKLRASGFVVDTVISTGGTTVKLEHR